MSKKNKKKVELDEFHYHEVVDRIYLIENNVDSFLLNHIAVKQHEDVKKRVKKASKLLVEAYQLMSGYEHKLFPAEKT